jgi:protocatechuate 3,4-dioxygenase beta subunit
MQPIRRKLIIAGALFPVGNGFGQNLACGERTRAQTEGPFFRTDTPRRTSLIEPGAKGERLILTGTVLSSQCRPVPNALLEFWHADEDGEYDNKAYRYRGHQYTDAEGRYRLETIVPGEYPGRTRHVHVKVQAPRSRVLTTQLYFPGDPGNRRDGLYRPELELRATRAKDLTQGNFDFVIEA